LAKGFALRGAAADASAEEAPVPAPNEEDPAGQSLARPDEISVRERGYRMTNKTLVCPTCGITVRIPDEAVRTKNTISLIYCFECNLFLITIRGMPPVPITTEILEGIRKKAPGIFPGIMRGLAAMSIASIKDEAIAYASKN
jgi:hypothetical protein